MPQRHRARPAIRFGHWPCQAPAPVIAALAAPAVLFTLLQIAFPFLYAGWLSLQKVEFGGGGAFVGAANFAAMLADGTFWNGLRVSLVLYAASLALQLVAGAYIALLLLNAKRMPGPLRSLLISPFMLPPVVAANYLLQ